MIHDAYKINENGEDSVLFISSSFEADDLERRFVWRPSKELLREMAMDDGNHHPELEQRNNFGTNDGANSYAFAKHQVNYSDTKYIKP
eukprot:CAMPEP_0195520768 /NCGR_PEP_ID=MMETSP0794_2-20130614/17534_1 /TAXON_ID=515487 /ORGANISM="Stephanopyxis turris, Strain CCMP 815" /LENGTH=87 /DNA_ID=CAMNT_0040650189 /DNA_START=184 /DNA_END=447 /DNA_ORIENTATION=+